MADSGASYAEITLKSGAVITFECVELRWRRTQINASLEWEQPPGAVRQPMHINLEEVAAVVFVQSDNADSTDA